MALRQARNFSHPYGSQIQTEPAVEPVEVGELFTHLKLNDHGEDPYLESLIEMARDYIEECSGIALITQTWLMTLDGWPGYQEAWWDGVRQMATTELYAKSRAYDIYLPRYPLQSITSITVYDEDSASTAVVVADTFDVDSASKQGRLSLKRGATWPIATRANNAVEIVYVSGYGDAAEDVPPPLRRAVLEMAAYMYTHRGDCTPEEGYQRSSAETIVNKFKVRRF